MSQSKIGQFGLINIVFLLILGTVIAILSSNKFEAEIFIVLVSMSLVIMEAMPESKEGKENEEQPKILYFDLNNTGKETTIRFVAKCVAVMIISMAITSIPPMIKYFF